MQNVYLRFRRKIRPKNTFHKLMLSYVFLIFLMLLTSMLVLYEGYKQQMIDQSNTVSEKFINQGEYYTQYTLGWARSYIYQLYLDEQVYNLMFDSNDDSQLVSTRYLKIKQAATMIPSVQSVYVYNRNTKMIYSSDGNTSYYSLFYDSDIANIIRDTSESMSTKFIPRQITVPINGTEYKKNVLTIILSNTKADADGTPYGAIVLNLDADAVQAYFENISEKDYNLMAVNTKGQIVLSSNRGTFLQDVSRLDYVGIILKAENKTGSFLSNISGKPSIVTYRYSEELGLFLLNIVKYETFMGSIKGMLKILISTFIILFIFGVAFSVFSSKRIYTPIANTVSSVKRYLNVDNDLSTELGVDEESKNEMEYVTRVIERLMNEPISFGKLSDKDLSFIKKQLLKGLLLNTVTELEGFKEKLEEAGFRTEGENLIAIVYKIDYYKGLLKTKSSDEINVLKSSLCEELMVISKRYFEGEVIGMEENEICLIIKTRDKSEEAVSAKLITLIQESQSELLKNFSTSLSVAIGKRVSTPEKLAVSYKTAQDCSQYRFKYGQKSILFNEKITEGIINSAKYDEAIEESIFKAVKLGNIDDVKEDLEKLFNTIFKMSYSDIVISITKFGINSQKVINNIYQLGKENAYIDIRGFTNNISDYETIEEVKRYFFELFTNVINQQKEKKANRKNDVIENVKKYIRDNYTDPLLSLEVIANEMRFSTNYLRTLFKDVEGKSISNYINEIRFEKAKELIETTELTAIEISSKIGFSNCNYFYTAFKKHYGLSPNQYRNNVNNVF